MLPKRLHQLLVKVRYFVIIYKKTKTKKKQVIQDRISKHVMDTDEQNGRTLEATVGQTNGQAMTEQILSAMKQNNDAMAVTIAVNVHIEGFF